MGTHPEATIRNSTLLKMQKGKCNHCRLYFREDDALEIDHITPKSLGGKDEYKNLQIELLSKLGSSNLDEQKRILSEVFPIIKNYNVCVLGDREFCSVNLANWLWEQKVDFCLCLKKNHFVERETEIWLELDDLGLSPGLSFFLKGVKVTKTKGLRGFNLACKLKRKILGVAPEEGWFILTNLDSLKSAISAYKKRFDIEEMFRDFKQCGYNLEDTNVSDKRLISLILLIAMPAAGYAYAYTCATISGQQIKLKVDLV